MILNKKSDWYPVLTEMKISEMSNCLDVLNKQLLLMVEEFKINIDEKAKQITDEKQKENFYQWYIDDYWNYSQTFPRILFNSFHVSTYSLLESEIYTIANILGQKHTQKFKGSAFAGRNYLNNASKYINQFTGIDISNFNSWTDIEDGRTLRNNIAHSNGILIKKHDIDIAKKYNLITETDLDKDFRSIKHLSITYNYNKYFISVLLGFFTNLYQSFSNSDCL